MDGLSERGTPESEVPLTVSPADTSLKDCEIDAEIDAEVEGEGEDEDDEKKPTKKRKSWGQELPVPKTNLPPRKRAKTDDEKEQRRIERVLRNRAAAQTSRERKRLEMEKLENEKIQMEQQNQFLLSRLSQMEAENNRLNQQVARLSAEVRGSRCSSPKPAASPITTTESPTLTPTLFKQERDDHLPLERIPFPTPSVHDYSPTLKPSTLAAPAAAAETPATDATQHPAVSVGDGGLPLFDPGSSSGDHDVAAPLSDDDFRRLFHGDSPAEPDSSVLEDGFAFGGVFDGGDQLAAFPFDSMVNFDPDSVLFDNNNNNNGHLEQHQQKQQASDLSDETARETAGVQPSLGASTSRCDGQSIAASG